ncbi:MAG: NAD(+)/NADH kinase [Elusimicrobiota bacterium]
MVLFHNEEKADAVRALKTVRSLLRRAGVRSLGAPREGSTGSLKTCDIAIAIGGDGTMLRTARVLAPYSVPLLGVKVGGLGFLSAMDLPGFVRDFRKVLDGKFAVEERWMLAAEARRGSKVLFGPHTALNDCVIRCSERARAVTLEVEASRRYVASYFGDGLVVSTPTGSTAYALAAGGPVVVPGVDAFLLAPISPHALTQRPLLTPAKQPLTVRLARRNPYDEPQALVSLDGQTDHTLDFDDEVHIRRAERPFMLLVPPNRSHFDLLRSKLKWGQR